jgi:hypothetical protein
MATKVYFRDSDAVAIYTLAAASYNIIRGLKIHQGAPDMTMKDLFLSSIGASNRKRVWKMVEQLRELFQTSIPQPRWAHQARA